MILSIKLIFGCFESDLVSGRRHFIHACMGCVYSSAIHRLRGPCRLENQREPKTFRKFAAQIGMRSTTHTVPSSRFSCQGERTIRPTMFCKMFPRTNPSAVPDNSGRSKCKERQQKSKQMALISRKEEFEGQTAGACWTDFQPWRLMCSWQQ